MLTLNIDHFVYGDHETQVHVFFPETLIQRYIKDCIHNHKLPVFITARPLFHCTFQLIIEPIPKAHSVQDKKLFVEFLLSETLSRAMDTYKEIQKQDN